MAFCLPCNRVFKSEGAFSMHVRDSKVHQHPAEATEGPTLKCVRCDMNFSSKEEMRLHIISSERHFACPECMQAEEWQDFLSERALKSHLRGKHKQGAKQGVDEKPDETKGDTEGEKNEGLDGVGDTPLDVFFNSFVGFVYDPFRSPEASWKKLRKFKAWKVGPDHPRTAEENEAWGRYQEALAKEVDMWFGDEKDLTSWRTLCKAVGNPDPPQDIPKCKVIIRTTHVNIIDLIAWGRKGGHENDALKVKVFKSVKELGEYTLKSKKIFTKGQLMEYNGGNVVLKHLRRIIFSQRRRIML